MKQERLHIHLPAAETGAFHANIISAMFIGRQGLGTGDCFCMRMLMTALSPLVATGHEWPSQMQLWSHPAENLSCSTASAVVVEVSNSDYDPGVNDAAPG